MVFEVKIIKQKLEFEECLKQRLEFICEFSKVNPTFIKRSIRKIEKANLSYIEPHKVIVKNITLLVFNYSNDVYISNLSKKIKFQHMPNCRQTIPPIYLLAFFVSATIIRNADFVDAPSALRDFGGYLRLNAKSF